MECASIVLKIGAQADLVLLNPQALNQPISSPVEISDPILDGEPRMVKRSSEEIVEAVYISGIQVVCRGQIGDILGRERLGTVLSPCFYSNSL
ncbi:hypothetical protein [Argonema antarcticum]|uniref:hypothetical protein n=1 Tax=Argonema antarcticum TaxID=2942763 RepID=UPI0020115793|nr:hypothetical protein [Argonema antarcticum]MCL1472228.1 hypothetical protein [Argonema antarcticum A004/B2]